MYKYCVLMAIPDSRRGERVNIGAVVFCYDKVDVRVPESQKLGCLSEERWDAYVVEAARRIREEFSPEEDPMQFVTRFSATEPVVKMSDLGWFLADTAEQYEAQVSGILSELVLRPKGDRAGQDIPTRRSKINAEIAAEFKKIDILANHNETFEDHKVKRDHFVSVEENLRADFVARNGVYHVTSTLDLRRDSVHIKEAGWKAIVLVEARRNFGPDTRGYGVYAAEHDAIQFRSHIELLRVHSNGIYNWLNPDDRWAYRQMMRAAVQRNEERGPGILPL
jgi:hypothetical protein